MRAPVWSQFTGKPQLFGRRALFCPTDCADFWGVKTGRLISADRVNYQAASSGPCGSLVHLQQGEVASHTPPKKKIYKKKTKKKDGNSSGFTFSFFFFCKRSGGGGCRLTVYHVDSACTRPHTHTHPKLDTWSVDAGAFPRGPSFLSIWRAANSWWEPVCERLDSEKQPAACISTVAVNLNILSSSRLSSYFTEASFSHTEGLRPKGFLSFRWLGEKFHFFHREGVKTCEECKTSKTRVRCRNQSGGKWRASMVGYWRGGGGGRVQAERSEGWF